VSTTDPTSSPDSPASTGFSEGQTLAGCYALSRRISDGGGPEIWLAQDEVLGKDVTLHMLPATVAKDGKALPELRAEVKRVRQLIHPQILRVYDLIEESDCLAISMNAFEGESVAARQAKQPEKRFAARDIESWVYALVQTIEDAHRINYLHRDLAPQNLFLTNAGQLLVANFGIGRIIQDALIRAGASDEARQALASPQTLGGNAPARTDDVYSLGALLYTLLAGSPPPASGNVSALEKPEWQVPPAWRQAIAAALQKLPESRPQTASDFLKRLKGEAAPAAAPAVEQPAPASAVVPVVTEVKTEPPAKKEPEPKLEPKAEPVVPARVEEKPAPTGREPEKVIPAAEPEPKVEITPAQPVHAITETKKPESQPEPKPEPRKETKPAFLTPPTEPKKSLDRPLVGDFKPRLYPEESSRFATIAVVVAVLALVASIFWYFFTTEKKSAAQEIVNATPVPEAPAVTPERKELRTIPSTPVPPTVVTKEKETPVPQTSTPAPVVVKATPAPAMSEGERAIVDKQSALDKARESARAAEKKHTDLLKDQQAATLVANASQKAVEDQRKTYTPIKTAADDAAAKRKKLEDDQKAAEAAAQEAQKVATEKARLVEEGKKRLEDSEKDYTDKQAAQEKANADLQAMQKTLDEKQKAEADAAKAAKEAEAALQQQQAAIAKGEKELQDARAVLDLNKSLKEKIDQFRGIAATNGTPAPATWVAPVTPKPSTATPIPAATPKVAIATPTPKLATPEPTEMVKLAQTPSATPFLATPAPATPRLAIPTPSTPAPVRTTPVPATPVPATPAPATPAPATPMPSAPMPATPAPATPAPAVTPGGATPEVTATNSLGMKFAPVGDVDFCIWLTRLKDFEIFAREKNLKSNSWRSPGFRQGPDHPVVNVTWDEALAFCAWLTDKEHSEGVLPANKFYRLPTDLEWSKAVGLPEEVGKTPEARDMGIPDVYPWGKDWPPPPGSGNYTGEETGSDVAIKGYEDGYAWTSPVGSFKANKYGLYDMGGNVWQWCMENWNNESKAKVLRGASWYNGALKLSLLSSCRIHAAPDSSTDNYGFRIVRASESTAALKNKFR